MDFLRVTHRCLNKLLVIIRVGGVAVHLAARIMDTARRGEVFVSATSKELASGAGVEFVERGSRDLKGFSGPRQLYEARRTQA